jgi:hypothetical protein
MKYTAKFPVTMSMSPISFIVSDKSTETKEQEALWYYNHARDHDGLAPLNQLPKGVTFTPIED